MKKPVSMKHLILLLTGSFLLVVALLVFTFAPRHDDGTWLKTAYEKKLGKIELVNAMRTNLLISAEAEKNSVMADTDEESRKFADQSIRASAAVEEKRLEFMRLLGEEKTGSETEPFQNFSSCWEKLREVDREVLALAVQNTNLKALRLSFTPAREEIQRLETALNQLMDSGASLPDAVQITRLASRALVDAAKIYMLQAPHIAETSDRTMDKMEVEMKRLDDQVGQSLEKLRDLVDEAGIPSLNAARTAYDDFRGTNAQIIELSRQNSNIRSFAMSIGQKRKVAAQCLDYITALDKAVKESVTFRATR